MDQNSLGQSDGKIFKSAIFLEQNEKHASVFVCWYKFIEIKSWLKNIGVGGVGIVINGCVYSSYRTLKLSVYPKNINLMTCFLYVDIIIETLPYRESYKITVVHLSLLFVFQLKIFLRNGWLVFSPFDKTVDNWNILKLTEPSFPGKLIFSKIRAKSAKMTFLEKSWH